MDKAKRLLTMAALLLAACTTTPPSPATDAAAAPQTAPASTVTPTAPGGPSPERPASNDPLPVPPLKGRPSPSPVTGDGEFVVTLHRGACFGRCPQYAVSVHADGLIEFVGERFVNSPGAHTRRVDRAAVAPLLPAARELFATVKDFTPQASICKRYATDFPSVSLSFSEAGTTRVIRHYLGCENPPPALTAFEQQVDAVAGVDEWVKGYAER